MAREGVVDGNRGGLDDAKRGFPEHHHMAMADDRDHSSSYDYGDDADHGISVELVMSHWLIAFTVAAAHTAKLFALARRLDNENNNMHSNMSHSERPESTTTDNVRPLMRTNPTLRVSVLYGLAVLSLGGTGSLLAMNSRVLLGNVACSPASSTTSLSTYSSYSDAWLYNRPAAWTTNVTLLPANVQKWARQQLSSHYKKKTKNADGFVYLPGSGTTVFAEWNHHIATRDVQRFWRCKIWTVSPPPPQQHSNSNANVDLRRHHEPVAIHNFAGHDFVLTSPHQACFVTIRSLSPVVTQYMDYGDIIACYDDDDSTGGKARQLKRLRFTKRNERGRQFQSRHPRNLISVPVADAGADTGLRQDKRMIWYLDEPPDRWFSYGPSDQLVYSLDPTTMIETLHSAQVDSDQRAVDGTSCLREQENQTCLRRVHALAWLWLCALPITVTSIYMWYHQQVSSMGLTTFMGLTFVASCLHWLCCGVAQPWQTQSLIESWSLWLKHDPTRHFIQWWMLIFGAIWTTFSIHGLLASSSTVPQHQQQQPQQKYKNPMWWGLHSGLLSCFVAMRAIMVELLPDHVGTVFDWAFVHALIWVPLFISGLAAKSPVLLVLTLVGVLWMDTMYVAEFFPVCYHYVEAMTVLMMALVGVWLSHRQGAIAAYELPPRRRHPPETTAAATTTAPPVTAATSSRSNEDSSPY